MFITINNSLLFALVSVLTISRAGWKISAWSDKWTIAVSINEQLLQHMTDSTIGCMLQKFSWKLHG